MADTGVVNVTVLANDLRSEDLAARLNAIRHISTIALAINTERTRNELLPFLINAAQDDADEVLCAMAEELEHFVQFVGGEANAHLLLKPLEVLAKADSQVVRDKAVVSLNAIGANLSEDQFTAHFVPLVDALATSEWFSHRISSTGLYPVVIQQSSAANRAVALDKFRSHTNDELPMVRRAAAVALADIAPLVPTADSQLLDLLRRVASDDQESVRLHAVHIGVVYARAGIAQTDGVTVLAGLAEDTSWRVRGALIEDFVDWVAALGPTISEDVTVATYAALLEDPEPEARALAVQRLPDVCSVIPHAVMTTRFVPVLENLQEDPSVHVRLAAAIAGVELAPHMSDPMALMSVIEVYLHDASPEVRQHTVAAIPTILTTQAVNQLAAVLLDESLKLSEDPAWRVRRAVVEVVPSLAKHLGPSCMTAAINATVLSWLGGTVWAIRAAAVLAVTQLLEDLPAHWASGVLVPKLVSLSTHPSYLVRVTTINTIQAVATKVDAAVLQQNLVPLVARMAGDDTPNVRLNAARVLGRLGAEVDATVREGSIMGVLRRMTEDGDVDVRDEAVEALAGLN